MVDSPALTPTAGASGVAGVVVRGAALRAVAFRAVFFATFLVAGCGVPLEAAPSVELPPMRAVAEVSEFSVAATYALSPGKIIDCG